MKPMQSVLTLTKRNLAALLMGMVALTGVANAEGHAHKGKTGNLKITAPTKVGGTILQPGDYRVREINSPDGAVVEFVLQTFDVFAPDGTSPYDEEVVARVKTTEQVLSERPKHTELRHASDAESAVALDIRGDAVEYQFEPSQKDGGTGAMASRSDHTSQNEANSGEHFSY